MSNGLAIKHQSDWASLHSLPSSNVWFVLYCTCIAKHQSESNTSGLYLHVNQTTVLKLEQISTTKVCCNVIKASLEPGSHPDENKIVTISSNVLCFVSLDMLCSDSYQVSEDDWKKISNTDGG